MPPKKKTTVKETLKGKKGKEMERTEEHRSTKVSAALAFSYSDWKNLVRGTFEAFPRLWWRIALVTVTVVLLVILSLFISIGIFLALVGGLDGLEGIITNFYFGGAVDFSVFTALFVALFIFINLSIVFWTVGKIANLLLIKGYVNQDMKNPLVVYFKDAWGFFWRYLWLGILVAWYIFWPVLVLIVLSIILAWGIDLSFLSSDMKEYGMQGVMALGVIGGLLFVVYRSINAFFAQSALIEANASAAKGLEASIAVVKGNWWRIFFGVVSVFLMLILVQLLINIPSIMVDMGLLPETVGIASSLLDFLFSFFIFSPIYVPFVYFMMLQVARNKKISLQ